MLWENEDVRWLKSWKVTSLGPTDPVFHVVLLPDVCCSASDQAEGFLGFCKSTKTVLELEKARIHFIDPPGQSSDGQPLPGNYWPSYDECVQELSEIISSEVGRPCLGVGTGMGADLLRRVAEVSPSLFRAFLFVAPAFSAPGVFGKALSTFAGYYVYFFGFNGHAIDLVLNRWFSSETIDRNLDLRERFVSYVEKLRPQDAARMIYAYGNRTEVPSKKISSQRLRGLVMCGRDSDFHSQALDAFQVFQAGQASIMEPFTTGSLVLDEQPEEVIKSVELFVRSSFNFT